VIADKVPQNDIHRCANVFELVSLLFGFFDVGYLLFKLFFISNH